ncbi:MAG: NAD(P)-dependent oxidoreductase [Bacteroidota bacterium]
MSTIKLGLIKEGKIPIDKRVPLAPYQCKQLLEQYPNLEIYIQLSEIRAFKDEEYSSLGLEVRDNLDNCDILMGIKEVPVDDLIPGKKYLFFSHSIKAQAYNRKLLQTILEKNIQLIDYERLTDHRGFRVLGFGRYAGIVGGNNGIITFGKRNNLFDLKPAHLCKDRAEMEEQLREVKLPNIKIVITGEGRVAGGVMEILNVLNIRKVTPREYIDNQFDEPVYCQLGVTEYNIHIDGKPREESDFFAHPENYKSAFLPYAKTTDLFISCHFWDPLAPVLFTKEDMRSPDFNISVIVDISCDINGSVPSTLKSTTSDNPVYGYNPITEQIDEPYSERTITVLAVDTLPNELPRDASEEFGKNLMESVFPHLFAEDTSEMIEKATITKNGELTEKYQYLSDFVKGSG